MVAMEHKRKTSWDSKISVSTVSTRRFSRAGTPSSILSSDSDIRFTRKLGSQYRCGCCVLAAFLLFLLVAGVSVYLGSTFLLSDVPNDQVFLATFRVIGGDAFTPELADPGTESFRQRSRIYRDRLNLLFRRSPLHLPFVAAEILALDGVENQYLMVHFDLRFDVRYGSVDASDVVAVLAREITGPRYLLNLTIDASSLEVQESASAANKLALQTNSSGNDRLNEPRMPSTSPRPPRRCSPIEFSYCKHLPYNSTSYPNFVGHASSREVHEDIIAFRELVDAECYKQAYDFICQVLQPSCVESDGEEEEDTLSPPCRGFCAEFWAGCGGRVPERLRAALDCSRFPEYADEGSCRPKPGCIRELKANALSSRLCDGVIDCPDFGDERDCAYCRDGQVHCGVGAACVPRHKRCDGKADCPNGSDEKDCLSLAPSLRSLKLQPKDSVQSSRYWSEGYVVFNERGSLGKICTENLNETLSDTEMQSVLQTTANSLCNLLTYEGVKSVEVRTDEEEDVPYVLMQDPTAPEITFVRAACPSKQVMYVRCAELSCGVQGVRSNTKGSGATRSLDKISGPGDWPWHAALFKEENHVCDATLVSANWLLTTSSCFQGQPEVEWTARLGTVRLTSSSPWQLERQIVGMVKSPVEGSTAVLLKLDRTLAPYSDFVRPVCLPPSGELIVNATQCNTLGWAKNRDLLQRVQLRYSAMEMCENVSIASVNSVCTEAVYPSDDCTEEEVAGSPILCQLPGNHRWAILGVSSWRIACSKSGIERPRLYDQISSNLAWIRSTVD